MLPKELYPICPALQVPGKREQDEDPEEGELGFKRRKQKRRGQRKQREREQLHPEVLPQKIHLRFRSVGFGV